MKYNLDIPGWMSETDLTVLNTLASLVPENGSILEIGSFCGRSTHALFSGKPKSAMLEVVDTFEVNSNYPADSIIRFNALGSDEKKKKAVSLVNETGSWLESFKYCLSREIVEQITVNVMSSKEYSISKDFDMAFIDAGHTFEDALHDIFKCDNENTLLVGDDFNKFWPGVSRAICHYRFKSTRKLIVPEDSKIWIMIPMSGYWREVFQKNNLF